MEKVQGLDYYLQSFSCRDQISDKCVSLLQADISGGRITKYDIDKLKNCQATEIWITTDIYAHIIQSAEQQTANIMSDILADSKAKGKALLEKQKKQAK